MTWIVEVDLENYPDHDVRRPQKILRQTGYPDGLRVVFNFRHKLAAQQALTYLFTYGYHYVSVRETK